jgi:hypothetical protein
LSVIEEKAQVIALASTWLFDNQLPIPTTDHKYNPKSLKGNFFPKGFCKISRRAGIEIRFKRQASASSIPINFLSLTDLSINPGPIGVKETLCPFHFLANSAISLDIIDFERLIETPKVSINLR